jgi:hypothetical protein
MESSRNLSNMCERASNLFEADNTPASLELDFGHSGIDPWRTRQERAGGVRKLDEVWWEGRHHEMTQPPMPLP